MKTKNRLLPIVLALAGAVVLPAMVGEARADTRVSVGVSIGARLPNGFVRIDVGGRSYFYHRGTYYRHTPRGYVVVRPPRGAVVRVLPDRYVRVVVGGTVYYRVDDIYYRQSGDAYVIVDAPVEAKPTRPDKNAGYDSIWLGDVEYLLKDGQFFRRTSEGLVWQEPPLGGVARVLPSGASSVWYQEVEYFEVAGVYFRKSPDGYKVVAAPWEAKAS